MSEQTTLDYRVAYLLGKVAEVAHLADGVLEDCQELAESKKSEDDDEVRKQANLSAASARWLVGALDSARGLGIVTAKCVARATGTEEPSFEDDENQ